MKTTILALLFVLIISCSKQDSILQKNTTAQLPPETQTGANTFGVTINGKVYIPRDPTGFSTDPSVKGMSYWGSPDNVSWNELKIKDGASAVGFNMIIHIQNLQSLGVNKYLLQQSNFLDQVDSLALTHIFFKVWDSKINNYAYYGSVENQGELNITRNSNNITSGNFKGKFFRLDNLNDFIIITDGRFDIGPGLYNKAFP